MNTDRLMADVARLATACAWWFWSCQGRPLLVGESEGEAERADEMWSEARNAEHAEANRLLDKVRNQRAALELLRERSPRGERARRHARHAIHRACGFVPIDVVHGFGPGWRAMPVAPLSSRPAPEPGVVFSGTRGRRSAA